MFWQFSRTTYLSSSDVKHATLIDSSWQIEFFNIKYIINMKKYIDQHKKVWSNKQFVYSVLFAIFLILLSAIVNQFAGKYSDKMKSNNVTDAILDNIPTVNMSFVFVEGFILLHVFMAFLAFLYPRHIPFMLKCVAMIVLTRSVFVTLTHLNVYSGHLPPETPLILQPLYFKGDLFFSGHTAVPFILAIVFWSKRFIRYILLGATVLLASSTLLMKLHYSIDVFAALFIAHSLFIICRKIFKKDYDFANSEG